MKRILILIVGVFFINTNLLLASTENDREKYSSNHIGKYLKFGIGLGFASQNMSRNINYGTSGIGIICFGEYRFFDSRIGLRTTLSSSFDLSKDDPEVPKIKNLLFLELPLRFYLDQDKQFALFLGPQFAYLTSVNKGNLDINLNKFSTGILFGFDFELSIGLIFGMQWSYGFNSLIKQKSNPLAAYIFHISYNFASLLN